MASRVTVHEPAYQVVGSPEWAARAIRWSRNTLKSIQGDARPLAQNLPGFRLWCEKQGKDWPAFCKEDLDADPAWVAKIEEGVAILEGQGHAGPISQEQAVDAVEQTRAAMAKAEPTKKPGAPKGSRNNPTGKAKGSVTTFSQKPRDRGATYLAGRIKAKAADDPKAAEVVAKVERGEYASMRAAARDAGVLAPPDPVRAVVRGLAKVPTQRFAELVAGLDEQRLRVLFACIRDRIGAS